MESTANTIVALYIHCDIEWRRNRVLAQIHTYVNLKSNDEFNIVVVTPLVWLITYSQELE